MTENSPPIDEEDPYQHDTQPLSWDDLDRTSTDPYSLQEIPVGESVWVPASFRRPGGFRAVKLKVVDRASVGTYEQDHALDDWDTESQS